MTNLYLIGGANGAGKTTTALQILPNFLDVYEYVNADEIAAGISPLKPESVAIQAGKIMLKRLNYLANSGIDFAFESTLAGRNYLKFLRKCKQLNYTINLIYFWLQTPELAIERVQRRVESGGHKIPEDVILRRYHKSRQNLIDFYLPLCDTWIIYDNSNYQPQIVATFNNKQIITYQDNIWNQIKGVN
jgi:predicted ABC-type ATPase